MQESTGLIEWHLQVHMCMRMEPRNRWTGLEGAFRQKRGKRIILDFQVMCGIQMQRLRYMNGQ